MARIEHPDIDFHVIHRANPGRYAKYGNLVNWLRSGFARKYEFYLALDYDSAVTGKCTTVLLAHLLAHEDTAFAQASISIDPDLVTTRYSELLRRANRYWLDASFLRVLSGQFGHNLVARTRVARLIDRAFPLEDNSESALKSHDWIESLWASVLGYSSDLIAVPDESLEGAPLTVQENIRRSIRWAFGSDRWVPFLLRYAFRADASVQLFGWIGVLNFVNQVLVVIYTAGIILFYPIFAPLMRSTSFERIGLDGGAWMSISHGEPLLLLMFVVLALFCERLFAFLAVVKGKRLAEAAAEVGPFLEMIFWLQMVSPVQSVMLAWAQVNDFLRGAPLEWKPPARKAGPRPGLSQYFVDFFYPSLVGLVLLAGCAALFPPSILMLWPLSFCIALLLSPWTAWFLDRNLQATSAESSAPQTAASFTLGGERS